MATEQEKQPVNNVVLLRRIVRRYKSKKDEPAFLRIGCKALKAGYFEKNDFMDLCMWKSARPKNLYLKNHPAVIKKLTSEALSTSYEKRKIQKLTELDGVSIPVASALLTSVHPENYGIIDIRVWQALYWLGIVNRKHAGMSFNVKDWLFYLYRLRYYAEKLRVPVRRLELSLFWFHKDFLQGEKSLYDRKRKVSGSLPTRQQEKMSWLLGK